MKAYYQHNGITIYHGDCREVLASPEIDADVIVTDPPYGLNVEVDRVRGARIAGDGDTSLRDWLLNEWYCPAIVFGSPKIPRPTIEHFTLIWDKGELVGMGNLDFPWKLTHEEIYVIPGVDRKLDGFKLTHRTGSVIRVPLRMPWTNHPEAVNGYHPTEKPIALLRRLIAVCPNGVILDPFCGSGTTLVAAKESGRKAVGIEIEERYCEIAAQRLNQEVLFPAVHVERGQGPNPPSEPDAKELRPKRGLPGKGE